MWVKSGSRSDLIDLVKGKESLTFDQATEYEGNEIRSVNTTELQFIWARDPRSEVGLPTAVILQGENWREFFAWTSTYLSSFRPLSAYCRVADVTTANYFLKESVNPKLGRLGGACLGLIFCEALTRLEGRREFRQLSPSICADTCSYAFARAMAIGVLNKMFSVIADSWFAARDITKQPPPQLGRDHLKMPWAILLSLHSADAYSKNFVNPPQALIACCMDIYAQGDIQNDHWRSLVDDQYELTNLRMQLTGPREERVNHVEKALKVLQDRHSKTMSDEFICGYLVSKVAPGTIDHIGLLLPYLRTFPSAILWYGLCAGLLKDSNIQYYSGSLGQRILRELLRNESFLERPRCDISLAELEVVFGSDNSTLDLRTGTKGQLEIELASCITTTVRWPAREGFYPDSIRDQMLLPETRNLLREFNEHLKKLSLLQQQIARAVGIGQGSLDFSRRSRKRDQSS